MEKGSLDILTISRSFLLIHKETAFEDVEV